jgi:hypothetical protein
VSRNAAITTRPPPPGRPAARALAGLALLLVGPFSGTPVGLTVFAVSSFLRDAVNRMGDLADDGKPKDSFKT